MNNRAREEDPVQITIRAAVLTRVLEKREFRFLSPTLMAVGITAIHCSYTLGRLGGAHSPLTRLCLLDSRTNTTLINSGINY